MTEWIRLDSSRWPDPLRPFQIYNGPLLTLRLHSPVLFFYFFNIEFFVNGLSLAITETDLKCVLSFLLHIDRICTWLRPSIPLRSHTCRSALLVDPLQLWLPLLIRSTVVFGAQYDEVEQKILLGAQTVYSSTLLSFTSNLPTRGLAAFVREK